MHEQEFKLETGEATARYCRKNEQSGATKGGYMIIFDTR
jgi:nitrite reductase/ring-hydroxylating ferredoxin subunit